MRVHILKAVFLSAAFSLCFAMPACAQEKAEPSPAKPARATAPSAYPNSADELRQLLRDCLAAAKKGDDTKLAVFVKDMEIPNYEAWFTAAFGSDEGGRLASSYGKELVQDEKELQTYLLKSARSKGELVIREVSDKQELAQEHDTRVKALRLALKQPLVFLAAYMQTPWIFDVSGGDRIGYFTYIDGGFRRLSARQLVGLSTFRPAMRIRVEEKVQTRLLIHKVTPAYPREAREEKIQGTVVLHAIIGMDGSIIQLQVTSGDPILARASVDAVRQWRYKPTLLDGRPVEVDTTVEVVFTLRN